MLTKWMPSLDALAPCYACCSDGREAPGLEGWNCLLDAPSLYGWHTSIIAQLYRSSLNTCVLSDTGAVLHDRIQARWSVMTASATVTAVHVQRLVNHGCLPLVNRYRFWNSGCLASASWRISIIFCHGQSLQAYPKILIYYICSTCMYTILL